MKNVLVLMSTYNGERYLREQIDSIIAQQDVLVKLLVRDDGSTDKTLSILEEYKANGLLDYYQGENLKPARSFMHLLQNAMQSEYYAFADQDDVWLPEKLSVAVNSLKEHEKDPALYFNKTQLVDERLNEIKTTTFNPYVTFGESLMYWSASGCTMVFNNRLRKVIGNICPQYIYMHDAWIYTIAQATGAYVVFDKKPHILYRQHTQNVMGMGKKSFKYKFHVLCCLLKRGNRSMQAIELYKFYSNAITLENRIILERFICGKKNMLCRFSLIFNRKLVCPDYKNQIIFWLNLIANRY